MNEAESPKANKKSSFATYLVVGLIILVLIGFGIFSMIKRHRLANAAKEASTPEKPSVRVVKPKLASDTAVILLPGTLQGSRQTFLYARVNGYVKNWYVDIGDAVQEGQLLAELETPDLDQQLVQGEANLALAKSSLDRVNSVNIEGAVSQQQKAERESAYEGALAQVNQLRAQKSFKRVTAPFAGVITARNIDIGALINSGNSGTNSMFTLAQIDRLRIFVNAPQSFVSNIQVGTSPTVMVPDLPGKTIVAKVTRTAGALDPTTRTLTVQVEFNNPGHVYLPGMYANVKFVAKRKNLPFVIPANTLVIRSDGPQVVLVKPDSTIEIKSIVISKDYGATIEVASGLKGEEQLVTNPSLHLTQGTKVSIAKDKPKEGSKKQ